MTVIFPKFEKTVPLWHNVEACRSQASLGNPVEMSPNNAKAALGRILTFHLYHKKPQHNPNPTSKLLSTPGKPENKSIWKSQWMSRHHFLGKLQRLKAFNTLKASLFPDFISLATFFFYCQPFKAIHETQNMQKKILNNPILWKFKFIGS